MKLAPLLIAALLPWGSALAATVQVAPLRESPVRGPNLVAPPLTPRAAISFTGTSASAPLVSSSVSILSQSTTLSADWAQSITTEPARQATLTRAGQLFALRDPDTAIPWLGPLDAQPTGTTHTFALWDSTLTASEIGGIIIYTIPEPSAALLLSLSGGLLLRRRR